MLCDSYDAICDSCDAICDSCDAICDSCNANGGNSTQASVCQVFLPSCIPFCKTHHQQFRAMVRLPVTKDASSARVVWSVLHAIHKCDKCDCTVSGCVQVLVGMGPRARVVAQAQATARAAATLRVLSTTRLAGRWMTGVACRKSRTSSLLAAVSASTPSLRLWGTKFWCPVMTGNSGNNVCSLKT